MAAAVVVASAVRARGEMGTIAPWSSMAKDAPLPSHQRERTGTERAAKLLPRSTHATLPDGWGSAATCAAGGKTHSECFTCHGATTRARWQEITDNVFWRDAAFPATRTSARAESQGYEGLSGRGTGTDVRGPGSGGRGGTRTSPSMAGLSDEPAGRGNPAEATAATGAPARSLTSRFAASAPAADSRRRRASSTTTTIRPTLAPVTFATMSSTLGTRRDKSSACADSIATVATTLSGSTRYRDIGRIAASSIPRGTNKRMFAPNSIRA